MCGNIAWSLGNCLASSETVSERFLILIPLHYRSARITVTVGVSTIYAAKDPVKEIDRISVRRNTFHVSLTPKALQDLLDELEASRASRKRAWENLQEIRWALKDAAGVELPPPARKTIDLEGGIVKDGVRKTVKNRQIALGDLVTAIQEFRKFIE